MFEGIIAAGAELSKMKGLRCVVLSGEGKAFCAGLDMASFAAMKQDGDAVPGSVRGATTAIQRIECLALYRSLRTPVGATSARAAA